MFRDVVVAGISRYLEDMARQLSVCPPESLMRYAGECPEPQQLGLGCMNFQLQMAALVLVRRFGARAHFFKFGDVGETDEARGRNEGTEKKSQGLTRVTRLIDRHVPFRISHVEPAGTLLHPHLRHAHLSHE